MVVPFCIQLAWDGSAFYGWQKQPHQRTVQGALERALQEIAGCAIRIDGCGRTDRGVHASVFVASGQWPDTPPVAILPRLRKLLPPDVHVYDVCNLKTPLHARHDATARRYCLLLAHEPLLPWEQSFRTPLARSVQDEIFARQATEYLGKHFFDVFAVEDSGESTILSVRVGRFTRGLVFEVTGNRFLRRQVRAMAGMLVAVASGTLAQDSIRRALDSRVRPHGWQSLSAAGLALDGIRYDQWVLPPDGRGWYNQVGEIEWLT